LFKLHFKSYKVLNHIDGTAPLATINPAYEHLYEIDAKVSPCIYGTLSDFDSPIISSPLGSNNHNIIGILLPVLNQLGWQTQGPQAAPRTTTGFIVMGFVGFFKLIFIIINNSTV
jgi:hypothetical protein